MCVLIYLDTTTDQRLLRQKVAERLYPANLPANPTPEQLAPVDVEPIRETERPDAQPWQQVVEAEPVDTDGDGVREQQWKVEDRPLADVQAERKRRLTQARDAGIFAGAVSYTLQADTDVVDSAGTVLSSVPAGTAIAPDLRGPQDQANLSQLASAATDALAAGQAATFDFKDSTDTIYRLSRDDMRGAAAAARAHGQAWWQAWWRHKDAVDATATAQAAYDYDPADHGGWDV
jgi:hypothetical protein